MGKDRRTGQRNLIFVTTLAGFILFGWGAALAQTTYGVFCANGRIEIEFTFGGADAPPARRVPVRPLSVSHGCRELRTQEFQSGGRILQLPVTQPQRP